eukprot:TRINITY_DN31142_c0_g1_i1.p1 TRINITY_DN31142_c0_g1~~TRINITY_DN31142_c0_g1_i1.p1  ORF type:complete len:775 (-),score=151.96 TRINITY_DN31142_c0_g1_i1:799-3123(-)
MGSGASISGEVADGSKKLPWPSGARALLYPGADLPEGLKLNGPTPCKQDGVPYWELGGPAKARLRVIEDKNDLLKLEKDFTVALCCRSSSFGDAAGYDSLLLGQDNKHWLAFQGDEDGRLCCLEGDSAKASSVKLEPGMGEWIQVFLRPTSDGGTSIIGVDSEGLLDLGSFPTSLTGSKLRQCGWATNSVHIVAIGIWDHSLPWSEIASAIQPPPPDNAPKDENSDDDKPSRTMFYGRVVDLDGNPLSDVSVKSGGSKSDDNACCVSDANGDFSGYLEDDAETTVPDDGASQGSAASDSSWISLSFQCDGYAPMSAPAYHGTDNSMKVTMRPISATATLDSAVGGSVVDSKSGSSLTVPPNALVYPDGSPVTGPVTVSLSVVDVTDPAGLASMPGDWSAIGPEGQEVHLQSLGAVWIGATDEKGQQLDVRGDSEGVSLDLATEASVDAEKLGTVPEMWSFDEASGKWTVEASEMKIDGEIAPNAVRPAPKTSDEPDEETKEERVARRKAKKRGNRGISYDPTAISHSRITPEKFMSMVAKKGKKQFTAPLKKLGYINLDVMYESPTTGVLMKGVVLSADRKPMPNVQLWSQAKDVNGRTADATGSDGKFGALLQQFDSSVEIEVFYKKPGPSDDVVDVYFKGGKSIKEEYLDETTRIANIPGQYKKAGADTWVRQAKFASEMESDISWNAKRRRWECSIGGEPIVVSASGDEVTSPFDEGMSWQLVGKGCNLPFAPTFRRAPILVQQMFGPFQTGPAGQLFDVGELVTDATSFM